jgi:DNA repair protein RecN (Recombination protein N)
MLTFLRVKNLALISDIELEFEPGLTVLTGETGAGKSLLIQAISLLTGKRPSESLLRRGESRAVVEGVFTLDEELRQALEEAGYPVEDEVLHVRRIIQRNGPNRAHINGETATLATLRSLLNERLQISGQHEHTMLRDPEVQLWVLDAFDGPQGERAAFGSLYRQLRDTESELSRLEKRREEEKKDRELYTFQVREIAIAGLSQEEYDQLQEEKAVMNHAETLLKHLKEALDLLYEQESSAVTQVQNALQHLEAIAAIDSRMEESLKNLKESEVFLDETVGALQRYGARIEFDPQRLEEVEERLFTYATLVKKYGGSVEAVLETETKLRQRLAQSENLEETIAALAEKKGTLERELIKAGRALSARRRKAAKTFAKKMTDSLQELGMTVAKFQVTFIPANFPDTPKVPEANETGFDTVSFHFTASRGEPPLPIREIASGGELSRILLATKALITGGMETQTIVFDEVDAGIGGRTADIVGRRIAEIAQRTQVLCITHLPQIAAYGDHHLRITKTETADHTRIGVEPLAKGERIAELARMLGGETVTDTTRKHAEELYAAAQSQKGTKP